MTREKVINTDYLLIVAPGIYLATDKHVVLKVNVKGARNMIKHMGKIDKDQIVMVWRKIQGSKQGTVMCQWQGHGRSSVTNACVERRPACLVRSKKWAT